MTGRDWNTDEQCTLLIKAHRSVDPIAWSPSDQVTGTLFSIFTSNWKPVQEQMKEGNFKEKFLHGILKLHFCTFENCKKGVNHTTQLPRTTSCGSAKNKTFGWLTKSKICDFWNFLTFTAPALSLFASFYLASGLTSSDIFGRHTLLLPCQCHSLFFNQQIFFDPTLV